VARTVTTTTRPMSRRRSKWTSGPSKPATTTTKKPQTRQGCERFWRGWSKKIFIVEPSQREAGSAATQNVLTSISRFRASNSFQHAYAHAGSAELMDSFEASIRYPQSPTNCAKYVSVNIQVSSITSKYVLIRIPIDSNIEPYR
jgi:hypothetical protein